MWIPSLVLRSVLRSGPETPVRKMRRCVAAERDGCPTAFVLKSATAALVVGELRPRAAARDTLERTTR
jgi:hypothetical protein